ncbi:hypothetical protein GCM10027048_24040 [Hymenobacter coalescens]
MLTIAYSRRGLSALLAVGLGGCQGLEAPDCSTVKCSSFAYDVPLRLDLDSLNAGFRRREVRSAYLVRYADAALRQPLDTTWQPPRGPQDFYLAGGAVSLLAALPAEGRTVQELPRYHFQLLLPAAGRSYRITNLQVAARTPECCPVNVRRRFNLNGTPVVADGENTPPTVLRR